MPPINQGSKAALITWTVFATVFGVTMAVLAMIAYSGMNEAERRAQTLQNSYGDIASDADLTGPRVTDLIRQAKDQGRSGNVLNYLAIREETLADRAAGTTDYEQAVAQADAALARLRESQMVSASTTSLTGAVEELRAKLAAANGQIAQLTQQTQTGEASLTQAQQQFEAQLADARAQVDKALEDVQEAGKVAAAATAQMEALTANANEQIQATANDANQQIQQREALAAEAENRARSLYNQNRILTGERRKQFEGEQMIASADGTIISNTSDGRLTINLGRQDGVVTGMTFQVYDSVSGIPPAESESALPRGKGSIQVIRADESASEARIVNAEPGQNIARGDLIANLAYNRNTPVRFRVYGDFDLDNNNVIDPGDRDRVLSLIREFGGRTMDTITVETDVVVMGRQPEVPNYTEEDLRDPLKAAQYAEAVRQREAYLAVQRQAQELNRPILSQNQFLYYVGYFDQINR